MGRVESIQSHGSNLSFWLNSSLSSQLKIDQSLSHNGVCLTIEEIKGDTYKVTAIAETLSKTNLGSLLPGHKVNLERCMQMNGRIDGHIVQGHVDTTANCIAKVEKNGSTEFSFEMNEHFAPLIIEKGSIAINGISLTLFNVSNTGFTVAIIPYTLAHTNLSELSVGNSVNIEFDIIGKYVHRMEQLKV